MAITIDNLNSLNEKIYNRLNEDLDFANSESTFKRMKHLASNNVLKSKMLKRKKMYAYRQAKSVKSINTNAALYSYLDSISDCYTDQAKSANTRKMIVAAKTDSLNDSFMIKDMPDKKSDDATDEQASTNKNVVLPTINKEVKKMNITENIKEYSSENDILNEGLIKAIKMFHNKRKVNHIDNKIAKLTAAHEKYLRKFQTVQDKHPNKVNKLESYRSKIEQIELKINQLKQARVRYDKKIASLEPHPNNVSAIGVLNPGTDPAPVATVAPEAVTESVEFNDDDVVLNQILIEADELIKQADEDLSIEEKEEAEEDAKELDIKTKEALLNQYMINIGSIDNIYLKKLVLDIKKEEMESAIQGKDSEKLLELKQKFYNYIDQNKAE